MSAQPGEQVDARRLRTGPVENEDDVSINAGVERAEQRGAIGKTPAGKSTLRQLGDEKFTVVPVVLDEKDAHRAVRLADTGKSLQWTVRLDATGIQIAKSSHRKAPASLDQDPKTELESIPTRADPLQLLDSRRHTLNNGDGGRRSRWQDDFSNWNPRPTEKTNPSQARTYGA